MVESSLLSAKHSFCKMKYPTDKDTIIAELEIILFHFSPFIDTDVFTAELNKLINFLELRQNILTTRDLNAHAEFTGDSIKSLQVAPTSKLLATPTTAF